MSFASRVKIGGGGVKSCCASGRGRRKVTMLKSPENSVLLHKLFSQRKLFYQSLIDLGFTRTYPAWGKVKIQLQPTLALHIGEEICLDGALLPLMFHLRKGVET